jgi:hypothetical protein
MSPNEKQIWQVRLTGPLEFFMGTGRIFSSPSNEAEDDHDLYECHSVDDPNGSLQLQKCFIHRI